jgi:lipopolysaccharide biosynthesis glycosyltransferase
VVEDGVSDKNKLKLEKSIASPLIKIEWIKMGDAIPTSFQLPTDKSTYPINIYIRVFIPYFIPAAVKKVLYLDVDMIMLADIAKLWKHGIHPFPVAAVQDPRIKTVDNSWGGIKNYKELGLDPKTAFFNSGLMIMDTQKWRKDNIAQKVIDCLQNNKKYLNYPDQYVLNVVLANNWLRLDPLWNHFADLDSQQAEPFLIHYIERKPIYKSYANDKKYQDLFFYYLNLTEWRNTQRIGEFSRLFKKIRNVVNKIKVDLGVMGGSGGK